MKFYFSDGFYKIVRITGPTHNILGLKIEESDVSGSVKIEKMRESDVPGLSENAILENVINEAEEANSQLNRNFKIRSIQYSPGDSPPEEIYKLLTMEIFRHL